MDQIRLLLEIVSYLIMKIDIMDTFTYQHRKIKTYIILSLFIIFNHQQAILIYTYLFHLFLVSIFHA